MIPCIQGTPKEETKEKPQQDGRMGKIAFRNPIPARDSRRAQTYLCAPGPRDLTETEAELCLSVSCRGTGQQWTAAGAAALATVDLAMASAL